MATLPRNVQAQLEAADALLTQANTPVDAPQPGEPSGPAQPENPPADQPPAVDPAPAPVEPPKPAAPPAENWEHKFKTLQGLFNAEVPKLQTQVKNLSSQLQQALVAAKEPPKQPEPPAQPTPDPKDAENFGQDLVEMVQRQVRVLTGGAVERLTAQLAAAAARLEKVEKALEGTTGTVAATAEDLFFSRLDGLVPDWEALNANEAYMAWLAEVDPVYGQPRQAALTAARQALDAQRVAAIFKAFKNTIPQAPKVDPLANQVSPRSGAAATAPAGPKPKTMISQADVNAFYRDVAQGRYRGDPAGQAAKEAEINLALAEGRIK